MTQRNGRLWLVDLKTCQSADPREFGRTAHNFGYHLQMAWYVTVARLLELDPNPVFVFVLVEKTPPHLVSVVELDSDAYQLGYRRMREAIDLFRTCRDWGSGPVTPTVKSSRFLCRSGYFAITRRSHGDRLPADRIENTDAYGRVRRTGH
ncbi:gp60 domain protein [Mycobacterium xenopi 3993]|nr:gp60 domain protein [Mycobacterium xenopi 3993]